jgi:ketosteroid isomerase-like protein
MGHRQRHREQSVDTHATDRDSQMIRQFFLTVTVLTLVGTRGEVWGQGVADSVRSLDRAWARAYATHDTVLADKLFADDLVVTSSGGQLKDKAGELGDVRPAPGLVMEFFRTNEVEVRLRKDTAVLTGVAEWAFTSKGKRSELRRRYTAVYVRGGPLGWQILGLQLGPAPAAASPAG